MRYCVVLFCLAWVGGPASRPAEGRIDAQPAEDALKKGDVVVNSIGMKLAYIPPGKFSMGSSKEEQDNALADYEKWTGEKPDEETISWRRAEGPEHQVEITRGFHLGVYEVTQGQYEKVMGKNPSHFAAKGDGKAKVDGLDTSSFPVEGLSYDDATAFCAKLSRMEGEGNAKRRYRLPTEAEWEYSCRGGANAKTPFHYGESLSSDQANFNGNFPYGGAAKGLYLERTRKVGSYKPNGFGLFDMHGNVWEWCSDWYGMEYYGKSAKADPPGHSEGSSRVLRGGSWDYFGRDCRSARRNSYGPPPRYSSLGFRVVLVPRGE